MTPADSSSSSEEALPIDKAAAAASSSGSGGDPVEDCGLCAICLDNIALQETALVKGCDHAYCVTCILRWASNKQTPLCPQCKHPFEFLSVHRSLDGCLHDYLFEESVGLLLGAAWFQPLIVEPHEEAVIVEAHEEAVIVEAHEEALEEEEFEDFGMDRDPLRFSWFEPLIVEAHEAAVIVEAHEEALEEEEFEDFGMYDRDPLRFSGR